MIGKLLKLIFNRWVIAGLGLTAIGLIIWLLLWLLARFTPSLIGSGVPQVSARV